MKYTAKDIEKMLDGKSKDKVPYNTNLPVKQANIAKDKPQNTVKKYTADDVEKMLGKNSNIPVVKTAINLPTKQEQQNMLNKVKEPVSNFKANYNLGKLSEEENQAWSEYRKIQSPESLRNAQEKTNIKDKYIEQNKVGEGNILTKDFAQYVPQMLNQIGAGLKGSVDTALPGAGVGASAALIAGQVGPQVLAPEEIITVPAGAVAGAIAGGKTGYMKGVADYSYKSMAGSAYKQLLDLGVPNDIALNVSGDEALISSLIEAAGAGVDIATLGLGKLLGKGATNTASKVAKNRLVSALKAYGVNVASEGLEEGLQEKVSIESEKKAMSQAGLNRNATGEEDKQRIIDSAIGGASIALVSGGGNAIGNLAVNKIGDRLSKNNQLTTNAIEQENNVKTQTNVLQEEQKIPQVMTAEGIVETPVNESAKEINTKSKAERYQNRQEKYFVESIADSLGISKFADKSGLKAKVTELTNDLKNETATPEKIDSLFSTILEDGIQVDFTYYNQYRPLKDRIRNSRIYVSDNIKNEFDKGEYNNFRKTNLGNLTLTKDGVSVDSYYQELSDSNPELFPNNITNPAEQLKRIAEVQNSIVATENNLNMYIDDNGVFKQGARIEFDKAVDKLRNEAIQVKKVQDEKRAKEEARVIDNEMVKNTSADSIRQIYELQNKYQKEYDKVLNKEILTDKDKIQVDRLVKGEITVDELPNGVNKGGIVNTYKAKEPLENIKKTIKEYNRAHKQFLRDEADMLTSNSMQWKEKKSGFRYQRETMERNIRDIVPDKKEAADIINTYFTPVHENEAKSTRMKNELRDRVRKLNLKDEAKYEVAYATEKGGLPTITKVSERSLVQLLGENLITKEMVKKSGADVNKIENAVKEFRHIYDDLLKKSNDVLLENGYAPVGYRSNYFPHFQEDVADNLLGELGRTVGLDVNTRELPTDISGLTHTFKPGKKWVGNFLQRTTEETVYDAVKGFDRYIEGVSDVIHHTRDIQRLRALEESIRYNYSSDGIKAEIDKIRENENMAEIDKRNRIEELYEIDKNRFPYLVTHLRSYTNSLAGKKAHEDKTMEHKIGRGAYEMSTAMENRIAANMVALNPGSWLTNFIPLAQGLGGVKSVNMFNGMKDTIKSYGKGDSFVDKSTFLTNRRGSEPLVMTKLENTSKKLSSPMQIIDNFTAESLVRAKYYDNMNKGMTEQEAIKNADKWAAGVMADRSKGALPTIFNEKNPLSKAFTMFQTEVNNQLSYLFKDVPDELKEQGATAIALAFTKIFVASWLYNELYEKVTGRRAALDPIDIILSAIGDFIDEDKSTFIAVANTTKNLGEELPFVGGLIFGGGRLPISSAVPNAYNMGLSSIGLATGEMNQKKALQVLGKELAKPLSYGVPIGLPVGGGQIKKVAEGISTVNAGGSFGVDSQGRDTLQFPAEKTTKNYVQSAIFGKYSLPAAKDYIDSGFKSLSGPNTEKYKDALENGFTSEEFLRTYEAQKKAESEKDKNGKTIILSLAKNKKKAIDEANPDMNKQKLEQLYEYFDVSEKVWKEEVKKEKQQKVNLPTINSKIKIKSSLPTIKDKK